MTLITLRRTYFSELCALFCGFFLLTSCAPKDDAPAKAMSSQDLVQADILNIQNIDVNGIEEFDAGNSRSFSKIFGGTSPANVMQYFNTRMHYFFTEDELANVFDNLSLSSLGRRKIGSAKIMAPNDDGTEGGAVIEAKNIGMTIWLLGEFQGKQVTVNIGEQHIPVNSSRVGIMEIGPGYLATIEDEAGKSHAIPSEIRQAVLIHEARHSDCTGGLTVTDVSNARTARTASDLLASMSHSRCGHLHMNCPSGHDYAGLPACDSFAWQAYSVESVYLDAVGNQLSLADKYILDVTRADKESRYADFSALKNNLRGDPDMSSIDAILPAPTPSPMPSLTPSPSPLPSDDPFAPNSATTNQATK